MATITKQRRAQIGLRSAGLAMTAAEFDALPPSAFDRNYRYQIIRGVLIVTPPAGNSELDPNEDLGYLLRAYKENHPQGGVIDKTIFEQTLPTTENRRRCDRAIWIGLGRVPDPKKDFPAIVVEFVSGSRRDFLRDYEVKRDEYRQAGALEYWIIDRFRRIMTIYRFARGPGTVETVVIVPETGSYHTDLLPGFDLPLRRLLRAADDWTPPSKKPLRKPATPEGDPADGEGSPSL